MKQTDRTQDKYRCPPPTWWDFAYLLPFLPGVALLVAWWL